MGSINSRPKAPAVQPYVPISVPSVTTSVTAEPVKTESEIAAEGRKESLLRRNRGRFGTILTGFRGFLDKSSRAETASKTLLGE